MTSVINDDEKPHKKSKHRKEKEGIPDKSKKHKDKEEGDGESVNEPEKETGKKEKKKKKGNSDTQNGDAVLAEEDAVVLKREKKKRKRDIEVNDEEASEDKASPKKKKKKTLKLDDHESSKKTSKLAGGDKDETAETTTSRKKSKKSRKNKTGFINPEQDEETDLPEQARKALSYAFLRFHDPDSWKFNKARQNWLVRNLWNFQSIPAKYEDLVVKYLSAVQGNTRENILKTCKEMLLDQSNSNGVSDKPASAGGAIIDTPTPANDDDHKKARAQALLKALAPKSAS